MPDANAAFVGSIPATYDRYLGPLLFHQYADDLVERLVATPGMRVLETACGTGIVTRRLANHLGPDAALVATDLNQAMIDHGRMQVAPNPRPNGSPPTRRVCPSRMDRSMRSCASSG